MTTTMITATATNERIAERLADLARQRAELPDDADVPLSWTRKQLDDNRDQRATIDGCIAAVHGASATSAALGSVEADEQWRNDLETWRVALSAELLTIKSPIRNPHTMGVVRNLTLSIKAIDYGRKLFEGTGWELETSKLGELMRAAGYEQVGADPERNYGGALPWFGSLPEVERRIAELAQKRAEAQAALDEALLDDATRATRDAESAELRKAFNELRVRLSSDGTRLVAYTADGDVLDPSAMTALQRKSFERMDAAHQQALTSCA